jgi:2-keto-4-pentenoate hydratase/2-oxohepta-3-ene-1,7-dioic acid hydratase in catechol pathway
MKLVTMAVAGGAHPGVLIGDEILDLRGVDSRIVEAQLLPETLRGLITAGDAMLDLVRRIVDRVVSSEALRSDLRGGGALIATDKARLLAPIQDPSMILCCSLNYREHLKEMGTPVPDRPTAFIKAASAIVGPGGPIALPQACSEMVDWEGEFCAVIGRPCYNVAEVDAPAYIAGYTLINDVSARDWVPALMRSTGVMGPIHAWEQSILGKQLPTFCPMGPVIATRDEIADPNAVQLTTTLNGAIMQSANTDDLVFGIAHLIAHYSRFYRLMPGDIVSTGSPSGVGYGRDPKVFLRPADVIEVHVDGVGTLSNPVKAA